MPFRVMSRSWRPDLLGRTFLVDDDVLGVKNFLNLFGVTVGGFFNFCPLCVVLRGRSGEELMFSWSNAILCRSYWLDGDEKEGISFMTALPLTKHDLDNECRPE
jgi:hypothetical protein